MPVGTRLDPPFVEGAPQGVACGPRVAPQVADAGGVNDDHVLRRARVRRGAGAGLRKRHKESVSPDGVDDQQAQFHAPHAVVAGVGDEELARAQRGQSPIASSTLRGSARDVCYASLAPHANPANPLSRRPVLRYQYDCNSLIERPPVADDRRVPSHNLVRLGYRYCAP